MAIEKKVNLSTLAYEGKLDEIKYEIEKDPKLIKEVDEDERTLLHWAVSGGHQNVFDFLLQNGSDLKAIDESGWTCLHIAVSAGLGPMAKEIVRLDSSLVNLANEKGLTPLFYAASKNRQELGLFLLENKAEYNIQDHLGQTPLHRASTLGHIKFMNLLLDHGARVNTIDRLGNTALHLACEEGREEEAKLLISRGTDPDKLNKEDATALDLAPPTLKKQLEKFLFDRESSN